MLDVEFLLERTELTKPLIYIYRSGALRHAVRNAFVEEMTRQSRPAGIQPVAELLNFLVGHSLIPSSAFCEWGAKDLPEPSSSRSVLNAIAGCNEAKVAVFLSRQHRILRDPLWERVCANALVLTEPEVCHETLPGIIRYLRKCEGIEGAAGIPPDPALMEKFGDLIEDGGANLFDVRWRYVEIALISGTTSASSKADRYEDQLADRRAENASFTSLKAFLTEPNESNLQAFIFRLEGRYLRHGNGEAILTKLIRWTARALQQKLESSNAGGDAWLLWAALMIAHERKMRAAAHVDSLQRRRKPDRTMFEWDALARDYMQRRVHEDLCDPIGGRWRQLEDRIREIVRGKGSADKVSVKLLLAMKVSCGIAPWSASPWRQQLGKTLDVVADIREHQDHEEQEEDEHDDEDEEDFE